jgi:hydroxymethylpyrimidine pyrophosphatase-like HAD family hydrolase
MSSPTRVDEAEQQLRSFLRQTHYATQGGIVTDLDGTVVHEDQGRIAMPSTVELALKELYELGRPVTINSLRFPLSVLRTFGADWYRISQAPIPAVSMNGSQIGYVLQNAAGELIYEEINAFPLQPAEIDKVLNGVQELIEGGIRDLLVFYYPRDWRKGEIIWTPVPQNVHTVKEKYTSASAVHAVEFDNLAKELHQEEICMIFLLIDMPEDTLMAYQHSKRGSFFTREGVDKLYGSRQLGEALGIDLEQSVGAGDTIMDRFLDGVGMAIHIGGQALPYEGKYETVRLQNSFELGQFWSRFVAIQRELVA